MFLIIVAIFQISGTVLSASSRGLLDQDIKQEYEDGAVMADIIGSGALNFQHYFYTLGVACENKNSGIWQSIEKEQRDCEGLTSNRNFQGLPHGSFHKVCHDWTVSQQCKINLALNLDDCLGGKKGSDAFEFLDAYVRFTCRDIRNTEAHLVDRFNKRDLIIPGVFRCFPALQDRISNCVKEDRTSISFCSQFHTVTQCYGKYYVDATCNDPQSIVYMRDLFRSMSADLKCPQNQNDDWNDKVYPRNRGLSSRSSYKNDRFISTSGSPAFADYKSISSTKRPSSNGKYSTRRSSIEDRQDRYISSTQRPPLSPPVDYPSIIYPVRGQKHDQRLRATSKRPSAYNRFVSSSSTKIPVRKDDQYNQVSSSTTERPEEDSYNHNNHKKYLSPVSARPYAVSTDKLHFLRRLREEPQVIFVQT